MRRAPGDDAIGEIELGPLPGEHNDDIVAEPRRRVFEFPPALGRQ